MQSFFHWLESEVQRSKQFKIELNQYSVFRNGFLMCTFPKLTF